MKLGKKQVLLSILMLWMMLFLSGCSDSRAVVAELAAMEFGDESDGGRSIQQTPANGEQEETSRVRSFTLENVKSDVWNVSLQAILSAEREFLGGYPLDDSFLLWFAAKYGQDNLLQIAEEAEAGQDANIWYELSGNSIHVLWLDYCTDMGMHPEQTERVTYKECASEEQIVLSFTGDMNFDDRLGTMNYLKANGASAAWSDGLRSLMADSDILMINNECTFSSRGEPLEGKAYTFRSDPSNVSILQELGVDIAGIANNHVCDYGLDALSDTIATLDEAGIPNVGAGNNIDEAMRPWYFVANGKKIAIVAATQIERTYNYTKEATEDSPGVLKTLDPERFTTLIREAKAHSDYVIAFVHWGTEGSNTYEADQVELAEAFAEAGADAVIGGHTHCLQGINYIGDVPVIYSLGNFWFGSTPTDGVRKRDTGVAQVIIAEDGGIQFRFVPCVQENWRTTLITDETEKARIIEYEQSLSSGVVIDSDGYVTKLN
jgi:poly-gamma-glutamate synthesis protein (capsule biosynthesis protein)